MPSWDEITPYIERDTSSRRVNAVTVIILANVAGLVLPAFCAFLKLTTLSEIATFTWTRGIRSGWVWQFLTYTFWHEIGIQDNTPALFWSLLWLAFGCYMLHTFGRELESDWEWKRFTLFYLATGVYGAVAHALYQLASGSTLPAFDFLGPVLAIFLVTAMRHPDRRVLLFFFFPMRMITAAWLLVGLVALFCLAGFHSGITPFATLGSVVATFLMIKLEPRLDTWLDRREQHVARARFLNEFELKRTADQLLEKINREGIESLTSQERKLLKRASELYADKRERHD